MASPEQGLRPRRALAGWAVAWLCQWHSRWFQQHGHRAGREAEWSGWAHCCRQGHPHWDQGGSPEGDGGTGNLRPRSSKSGARRTLEFCLYLCGVPLPAERQSWALQSCSLGPCLGTDADSVSSQGCARAAGAPLQVLAIPELCPHREWGCAEAQKWELSYRSYTLVVWTTQCSLENGPLLFASLSMGSASWSWELFTL